MAQILNRWNGTEWVPVASVNRMEVVGGISKLYNMNILPENDSPALVFDSYGTYSHTLNADGTMTLTTTYPSYGLAGYSKHNRIRTTDKIILKIRAKIIYGSHIPLALLIRDGKRSIIATIDSSGKLILTSFKSPQEIMTGIDASNFFTMELVKNGETNVSIYINGVKYGPYLYTSFNVNTSNVLQFSVGANSTTSTNVIIDYMYYFFNEI